MAVDGRGVFNEGEEIKVKDTESCEVTQQKRRPKGVASRVPTIWDTSHLRRGIINLLLSSSPIQ